MSVLPTQELIRAAKDAALSHQLPGELVCAIVEQESSWRTDVTRYEPAFQVRYVDKMNLPADEARARSTSWGLMQLMGEVARELGFKDEISTLLQPAVGLEWGCRHFANKLRQAGGDVHTALLKWNGGGNPNYADEVEAKISKYQS